MKRYLPAAICLLGMLTCAVLVRNSVPKPPDGTVEITVHTPDGGTIPAMHRVGD